MQLILAPQMDKLTWTHRLKTGVVDPQRTGEMSLSGTREQQEELHLALFSIAEHLIVNMNC